MKFYLFLFVLLLSVPFTDLMAPPKRLLGDRNPNALRSANSLHDRPGGIPFVRGDYDIGRPRLDRHSGPVNPNTPLIERVRLAGLEVKEDPFVLGNAPVCDQAIEVRGILHGKLDPAKNTLAAVSYSASETDNLYTMASAITLTPYVENITIREDVRADDEGNANPNDTLRMRVQETGGILQEDPTPVDAPSLYKQVDDTRGSLHTKLDAVDDGTPQTVGYGGSGTDTLSVMVGNLAFTTYDPESANVEIRKDIRADDEGNADPADTTDARVREVGLITQEDPIPVDAPSLYKQVDDTRGSLHTKLDAVDDGTPQTVGYGGAATDTLSVMVGNLAFTTYDPESGNVEIRQDIRADDEGNADPADTTDARVREVGLITQEDPTPVDAPSLYKQIRDIAQAVCADSEGSADPARSTSQRVTETQSKVDDDPAYISLHAKIEKNNERTANADSTRESVVAVGNILRGDLLTFEQQPNWPASLEEFAVDCNTRIGDFSDWIYDRGRPRSEAANDRWRGRWPPSDWAWNGLQPTESDGEWPFTPHAEEALNSVYLNLSKAILLIHNKINRGIDYSGGATPPATFRELLDRFGGDGYSADKADEDDEKGTESPSEDPSGIPYVEAKK